MKILKFALFFCAASLLLFSGCSRIEEPDYREKDYGYVQFKLYKEASYEAPSGNGDKTAEAAAQVATRAGGLEYLSEAAKINVTLRYQENTVSQTLILNAADKESAEYGLRSTKLKLLAGDYEVLTFALYGSNDEQLYTQVPENRNFTVIAGGNVQHDLTADVTERGKVRFTFVKANIDEINASAAATKAASREYAFSEIRYVDIAVQHTLTSAVEKISGLEVEFDIHFKENDDNRDGWQTSSLLCDSLVSLVGGEYRLSSYTVKDESKIALETKNFDRASAPVFTVLDNETTDFDVPVTLEPQADYIQDYYALKTLWENLNGPEWSYYGENYAPGTNWDFNKDVDLWGEQPGVKLHGNGRVAFIDISDFAFKGFIGPEIGRLTELVELYLGTHNDTNILVYDPSLPNTNADYRHDRMGAHREYLSIIHPMTQVSGPSALAAQIKGVKRHDTALYDMGMTEDKIFDMHGAPVIRPMDTNHGKICNNLESIDEAIGNLTKLEVFYIANSAIEKLPEAMKDLKACTDLEIYNCPNMKEFPVSIGQMPELVSVNLSNNAQWSSEECRKGMEALAGGASAEKIQILYFRQNNLKEVTRAVVGSLKKIGLLDLSTNKISRLEALGKEISFVQLHLDHNEITEIPVDDEGYFCGYDDVETLNLGYNKLTEFPNIFRWDSEYTMGSIELSYNQIASFPKDFKGVNVSSLGLAGNRLEKYPEELHKTNSVIFSLNLRANGMKEIPDSSFVYDKEGHNNMPNIQSIDLSYNKLKEIPKDLNAVNMPYLYSLELSSNCLSEVPTPPLSCSGLTVYSVRGQRSEDGSKRILKKWPVGIYKHTGLRGLFLGSNDLGVVDDTISFICYNLDISDNPNIEFDAKDICSYWMQGLYILMYDKTQNIINCPSMLD